ncbi:MAG: filamentous hemagglutinin N-terminal domain-containing protein, partial [Spongiibacteraceae bacterium]
MKTSDKNSGLAGNKKTMVFMLCISHALAPLVLAAPAGGNIVGGNGAIGVNGVTTSIDQLTDRLAIDWQSFDLSADEIVRFNQPNQNAIALNRILSNNPSKIMGLIEANGRVILSNPSGILFTESSRVNVNALVASGLDIAAADFMAGNLLFKSVDGLSGSVINRGLISAATGVSLLGNTVNNEGSSALIQAELVLINAASEALLTFDTGGLLGVKVNKEVMQNSLGMESAVSNSGSIIAGNVLVEADVAAGLFEKAVNNTGLIQAAGIDTSGGVIRLSGRGGDTFHSGTLDVGSEQGKGGRVVVEGDRIALTGNALIDAAGATGGGDILVGGDYQGGGDTLTSQTTNIDAGAVINANATDQGDGGKVIIWSDGTTESRGQVSARGGERSGNGGFIEISGKQHVLIQGHPDLRSANGIAGTLLIDPGTVTITRDDTNTVGGVDVFSDSWINTQLSSGNVEILTSSATSGDEDIVFNPDVSIDWSTANSLTLTAGADIIFDASVSITNNNAGGSLALNFGQSTAGALNFAGASFTDISVVIVAGDVGNDTIIGGSNYQVTGANSGSVDGFGFTKVENLTGLAGSSDSFTFSGAGELTGVIDGVSGIDTADYSAVTTGSKSITLSQLANIDTVTGGDLAASSDFSLIGGNSFAITGANDGMVDGVTFTDWGNLIGAENSDDSFVFSGGGALSGNIDGGEGVEINGDTISGQAAYLINTPGGGSSESIGGAFSNIENLTGTINDDAFVFVATGSLSGVIDGAGGTDNRADYSALASATANLANINNIQSLTGGGSGFTLAGGTAYTITGANTGTVDGIAFTDWANLTGSTASDSFTFDATGTLSGLIDGVAGAADEINYSALANKALDITSLTNID